MICRRCKTENPDGSRYCQRCGALLPRPPAATKKTAIRWYVIAIPAILAVLAAAYFLIPGLRPPSKASLAARPAAQAAASEADRPDEQALDASAVALVAERINLEGFGPGAPASIETALFDGSWAALPLWAFLGAAPPRLEGGAPVPATPDWADWRTGEPIVLCRFDSLERRTPELSPFEESGLLEWRPLGGERTAYAVETGPLRYAGAFRTFALFREIERPGVLLQKNRIVGWTFGHGLARGYLWSPAEGPGPKPVMAASELSGTHLAGSQEAAFVRALSMPENAPAALKLSAFASGFREAPLLSPEDLPLHLKPALVATRLASLASRMVQEGLAAEVRRTLDPDLLAAAADVEAVKAAAAASGEGGGFDAAHRLLSDLRRRPAFSDAATARGLDAVEVDLAKSFLRRILNEKGYGALGIYEETVRLAPNDVELRFLGIEAAVLERKWGAASGILRAGAFPDALSDKARALERQIEEGLREENSATIRFNPGDKLIPVYAYINKQHRQKFFIDTGATTTIIPSSALEALGIQVDSRTPVVVIQGVAGSVMAFQVRLDSIEIEGQTVFDIKAIVYDLNEEEDAGLLGNDFLQHFQVDLDSIKGVLKLRKK